MLGEWLPDVQKSLSELVTQGAGWLLASLQALWSGGTALISVLSLIVVTPIVAFYLLYDWERMIRAIDSWLPLQVSRYRSASWPARWTRRSPASCAGRPACA